MVNTMSKIICILGGINLVISLLFVQSALANCRDDIIASTPSHDFTLHNDGTVTHNSTSLMWMRCSLGQTWDGSTCTGATSTFTWQNALGAAQSHSFAGHSDWRLPNKNELASIVERRCASPAINSMVFPNTPRISRFWSSSPSANYYASAWYVDFDIGNVNGNSRNNDFLRVRLVRVGQ